MNVTVGKMHGVATILQDDLFVIAWENGTHTYYRVCEDRVLVTVSR